MQSWWRGHWLTVFHRQHLIWSWISFKRSEHQLVNPVKWIVCNSNKGEYISTRFSGESQSCFSVCYEGCECLSDSSCTHTGCVNEMTNYLEAKWFCLYHLSFTVYRKGHTLNQCPSLQITAVNQFCSAMKSCLISVWYQTQTRQSISGSMSDEGAMHGWMESRSP